MGYKHTKSRHCSEDCIRCRGDEMILTDNDYDLIIQAVDCSARGCAPCQNSTMYDAYDRILRKLIAYKKDKISQRGRLGI